MYDSEGFRLLKNNRIIIYGTGYVAMKFYDALTIQELDRNIEFFLVSKKDEVRKKLKGIKIISIDEFENSKDRIICVAVHEAIKDEIEEILNRKDISNYIWINRYFLIELLLGRPIKKNVWVPVDQIIRKSNNYAIAVRYLVIEQYFGKNNYGYDLYKKVQGLYCNKETAKRRLHFFCSLIHNCENFGYNSDSLILIDKNNELLDGMHRTVLAKYYQVSEVLCDIFANPSKYCEWMGSGVILTQSKMEETGFSYKEIKMIEDAYRKIRGEK